MSRIIAIANQKGGVGKTTTVLNLGIALAQRQQRVLLVDLDPQGGLTVLMGYDPYHLPRSTYSLLMHKEMSTARAMKSANWGMAFIPGSIDLAAAAIRIIQEQQPLDRLRHALRESRLPFDYILIDTPPSLDIMTAISLVAADEVIIPAQCHYLAMIGIRAIIDTIERVKNGMRNPALKLRGVLPTMYDASADYSQYVVDELRAVLPGQVFQTPIPYDVHVSDSPHRGRAVVEDSPESPAAVAYQALAEEFLANKR